jgi:16S rRNA (guanine966-N2)-methyltransferase
MRITGGEYRGRLLETPKDMTIRPTSDKVRQAVFNVLNARGLVDGAVILDGFCGTGALGIEALSWGGLCCTFIDKNPRSLDLCRKNYAALKIPAKSSFVLRDCSSLGLKANECAAADLAFLDPPYSLDLITPSLTSLTKGGWLAETAHVLIETEKQFDPSSLEAEGYNLEMTRDYGDTRIALLVRAQNAG